MSGPVMRGIMKPIMRPIMRGIMAGLVAWTPQLMFGNSEQGAIYDPSYLAGMWQDSGGAAPVYQPGQGSVDPPVGFISDLRNYDIRGANIAPSVLTTAGWTPTNSTLSIVANQLVVTSTNVSANAIQSFPTVIGQWYEFAVTIGAPVNGGIRDCRIGSTSGNNDYNPAAATVFASATNRCIFKATSVTAWITLRCGDTPGMATAYGPLTCNTIGLLAFNPATQATAASRPVLSGRVNQLVGTNAFNTANWTKNNVTAIDNAVAGPDGVTVNASSITNDAVNVAHQFFQGAVVASKGTAITAKAGTANFLGLNHSNDASCFATFDLSTGTVFASAGCTPTAVAEGNGFYRCSLNLVNVSSVFLIGIIGETGAQAAIGTAYVGTGKTIYVMKPQLELAASPGTYQRVVDASNYDTAGFPLFLKGDGVDDQLVPQTAGANDFLFTVSMLAAGFMVNSGVADYVGISTKNQILYFSLGGSAGKWGGFSGAGIPSNYSALGQRRVGIEVTRLANDVDLYTDNNVLENKTTGTAFDARANGLFGLGLQFAPANFYGGIILGRTPTASEIAYTKDWLNQRTRAY